MRAGVKVHFFPYAIDLGIFSYFTWKTGSIPWHKIYYMKDMASFKKRLYDKVKLVNTVYYVPHLPNHNVFSYIDTTGKSYSKKKSSTF